MSSPCDYRIDAFTTTYPQVYTAHTFRRRKSQNSHGRLDCIIDVHSVNEIFSVTCHSEVRVALKGELANEFRVKLTWRLVWTVGTEEAHNRRTPGRLVVLGECPDVLLCCQLRD